MLRGDRLDGMLPNKKEMFNEILRRVLALRKQLPRLSVFELVCKVVYQPAPKFYLQPGAAKVYYYRTRAKWKKERRL